MVVWETWETTTICRTRIEEGREPAGTLDIVLLPALNIRSDKFGGSLDSFGSDL